MHPDIVYISKCIAKTMYLEKPKSLIIWNEVSICLLDRLYRPIVPGTQKALLKHSRPQRIFLLSSEENYANSCIDPSIPAKTQAISREMNLPLVSRRELHKQCSLVYSFLILQKGISIEGS